MGQEGRRILIFSLFQTLRSDLGSRMADQQHLYSVFTRRDKEWVTRDMWADVTLKKHIPALKAVLAKMPSPDRAAIDRENKFIEKRGRIEDIAERLSWETMSVESMMMRRMELKMEVAALGDEYLVGGGREWPLTGGGEGGSRGGDEGRGGEGRGGGRGGGRREERVMGEKSKRE